MLTLAELTGTTPPADVDGISIMPTLLGSKAVGRKHELHEFLYWEYRSQVAVGMENWKAIQPKKNADWELYDLARDFSETTNVADRHPELIQRMPHAAEYNLAATKIARATNETAGPNGVQLVQQSGSRTR